MVKCGSHQEAATVRSGSHVNAYALGEVVIEDELRGLAAFLQQALDIIAFEFGGEARLGAHRRQERKARDARHVDGAQPFAPAVLLTGVKTLRIRYRRAGEWRAAWDAADPKALPDAVEVVTDVERVGTVRQLFLVGTGA